MKKLLTATLAAVAMLATVPTPQAATFWTEPGSCNDDSKGCVKIHVKGELVRDDAIRFVKATAKIPAGKALVYLDSPGGLAVEGLVIAVGIHRQKWNTYVDADTYCLSMCANIWLAGNVRYINPTAKLGFHTISVKVGRRWFRDDRADAAMLNFYRDMGVSAKAGRVFTAADGDDVIWLNSDLAKSLDIKATTWSEEVEEEPKNPVDTKAVAEAPPKPVTPTPVTTSKEPGVVAGLPVATTLEPGISIVAPQRAVLYDEDPSDPKGKQYIGSVVWRTEPVKASGNQKADIAVRADIEVPDRKFKMTMSFRRNTDSSLPASHTAELTFILPPDFAGGGVGNVPGILMKSNEPARGAPLAALAVKVTDGFFLVGLSNVDADRQRNIRLLKNRSWFDVPLVYANQRRAILAIEKGPSGEQAFANAFQAWHQIQYQTTRSLTGSRH
jgi:hypothetical protein